MFENLITNIKRKFSKTSDEISPVEKEKSGFKKSLQYFKTKFSKPSETNVTTHVSVPNYYYNDNNMSLSPRAIGAGECAQTEIEWPNLCDTNPNILDKFTRIVTTVDSTPYDRNVRNHCLQ